MKEFVIGIVLSAVLLAVVYLAPSFLRSSERVAREEAARDAEAARRMLSKYDPSMALVEARAALEALRSADMSALAERVSERLDALATEFRQQGQRARSTDERAGLEHELRAVSTNAGGLSGAVSTFASAAGENNTRLREALQTARRASTDARDLPLGGLVAGTAQLADAALELSRARVLRIGQDRAIAEAVDLAREWSQLQSRRSAFADVEYEASREILERDLEEITAAVTEAERVVRELVGPSGLIPQREADLSAAVSRAQRLRAARLELQETGFTPGVESGPNSFAAYREEFRRLSRELDEAETRIHLLREGGLEGATFSDEDELLDAELTGGAALEPLATLRARLEVAEDKLRRLTSARDALAEQLARNEASDTLARSQTAEFDRLLAETNETLRQRWAAAMQAATEAAELEETAIDAARNAARQFQSAASAAAQWKRAARDTASSYDPEGQNERLRQISSDSAAETFAKAAGAESKTIAARGMNQRIGGIDALQRASAAIETLVGASPLDDGAGAELQEARANTREDAITLLNEARETLSSLAERGGSANVADQMALATVHLLLARVDELNSASHRSTAETLIDDIIAINPDWPYLGDLPTLQRVLRDSGR